MQSGFVFHITQAQTASTEQAHVRPTNSIIIHWTKSLSHSLNNMNNSLTRTPLILHPAGTTIKKNLDLTNLFFIIYFFKLLLLELEWQKSDQNNTVTSIVEPFSLSKRSKKEDQIVYFSLHQQNAQTYSNSVLGGI